MISLVLLSITIYCWISQSIEFASTSDNKFYVVEDTVKTYTRSEANAYCDRQFGTQLATGLTADDLTNIYAAKDEITPNCPWGWIGLEDPDQSGWRYQDGQAYITLPWYQESTSTATKTGAILETCGEGLSPREPSQAFNYFFCNNDGSLVVSDILCNEELYGITAVPEGATFTDDGNGNCDLSLVRYASCCNPEVALIENDLNPAPDSYVNYVLTSDIKFGHECPSDYHAARIHLRYNKDPDSTEFYQGEFYTLDITRTSTNVRFQLLYGDYWRSPEGTFKLLSSQNYATATADNIYYNLKISVIDNTITAFWSDQEAFSYTESDPTYQIASGSIGFGEMRCSNTQKNAVLRVLQTNIGCTVDADCGDNAACDQSGYQGECSCITGFTGNPDDGISCTDIDECDLNTDNCDGNAVCDNIAGSFTCTCPDEYFDSNGDGTLCNKIEYVSTDADGSTIISNILCNNNLFGITAVPQGINYIKGSDYCEIELARYASCCNPEMALINDILIPSTDTYQNYELTSDIKFGHECPSDYHAARIHLRYNKDPDSDEFYQGEFYTLDITRTSTNVRFQLLYGDYWRSPEGIFKLLSSQNYATTTADNVYYNLKISVIDNTITAFWDGQQAFNYIETDPTYQIPSGSIGFGEMRCANTQKNAALKLLAKSSIDFELSYTCDSLEESQWVNKGTLGSSYNIGSLTGTVKSTPTSGTDLPALCFDSAQSAITYIDYNTNANVNPELSMEIYIKPTGVCQTSNPCPIIWNEEECVSSTDGRSEWAEIYGQPCVYCNGACLDDRTNVCEPKNWLDLQSNVIDPSKWEVATCGSKSGFDWFLGHDDGGFDRAIIGYDTRFGGIAAGVGNTYTASSVPYPADNEWTQIIATFSKASGEANIYKNSVNGGQQSQTVSIVGDSGSIETQIGLNGLKHFGDHNFFGCIAQVQIINRVLSDDEIGALQAEFDDVTTNGCAGALSADDHQINDNEWRIYLSSSQVMGIGGLLSIILLLNIMCACYMNCNGKRRKKKGYAVVKYDSESIDESEANVINVNNK